MGNSLCGVIYSLILYLKSVVRINIWIRQCTENQERLTKRIVFLITAKFKTKLIIMSFFFGARGSMLVAAMSSASSLAFLLIGWDQGKDIIQSSHSTVRFSNWLGKSYVIIGVLGGLLSGKLFLSTLGNPNASQLGTITAVVRREQINFRMIQNPITYIWLFQYDLGCLGGSIMTMFIGEKLGRQLSTMIGLSIVLVGAILQTSTL